MVLIAMMPKKPSLYLCGPGLLFLLITACVSPKAVYRLQPVDQDTLWLFGNEYTRVSNDSIEVAVAFDHAYSDQLVLDIEIANLAADPFIVSPEIFSYIPLASMEDTLAKVSVFADNPERELLEIDKSLSKENANYATATAVDLAVGILDLFAHIATIGQEKTVDEEEADAALHADLEDSRISREVSYNNHVMNLNAAREEWQFEALRRTTLNPKSKIQGKIYFPISEDAHFLKFMFPIGDFEVTVFFEQHKHKV